MKNKIFKLLSVVMALAMVFTMFACVSFAEEAIQDVVLEDGVYPAMMQGNIYKDGNTGELVVQITNPERICTANTYNVADYSKLVIAAGFRANVVFLNAEGGYVSNHAWKTGTVDIAPLAGDAPTFRVVISADPNANPFTTDMFPAEGLKLVAKAAEPEVPEVPEEPETPEVEESLTFAPELTQGTIDKGVIMPQVNTRFHTVENYKIADFEKFVVAKGYKVYYHYYDAEGKWLSGTGWKEAKNADLELSFEDVKKNAGAATHVKFVFSTLNNDALSADKIPANGLLLTKVEPPVYPEFTQGTIDKGAELAQVNTRFFTPELLNIADYKKITVAKGYKIYLHFYDAEGKWVSGAGWKEAKDADLEITGVKVQKDAAGSPKMKIVVSTLNNDALTAETLPDNAVGLHKIPAPAIPEWTQGTIDKGVEMPQVNTRFFSVGYFKVADFERISVASGWKIGIHYYDDANTWLTGWSWVEGDKKMAEIKSKSAAATKIKIVVATSNNDPLSASLIPADVVQLFVVGTYGACAEHEVKTYTSNNDATCTVDGTKTGTCTICGEAITVKDEYSAIGHKFDNAEDVDCNNGCGYVRDLTVPCEHKYGKYVSNKDATCELDGTKTATCLLCGETDTVADEKTALGHDAEYTPNNDATCDTNATETGICKRCEKEVTRPIEGSALGHKFASDADDFCSVCGTERTKLVYYVYGSTLGGVNTNDGLTAETPLATIEKAIELATAAGAGIGDIVVLNVAGTVAWGGKVDGNWENITAHDFKIVLTSEDGKAYVGDGAKNIILGGPVSYENVVLNANNNWKTFCANGNDFTFGKGYASDMYDFALGGRLNNLNVNKDITFTFNAFFPKIWVGNRYNIINYNKNFTLNLNGNTHADGSVDTRPFILALTGDNTTNFNGIATIVNNTTNALSFIYGSKVKVGENGALNFINKNTDSIVDITTIGLTDEALAKTWVLNTNNMATLTPVAPGEFEVQMGYIATAAPVEGDAIKSVGGKLVLPAGQYSVSFALCDEHEYDDDYDADCNLCGATREVEEVCQHVWGEYVFDNNANCETLGTETRTCELCFITETRPVEGVAPGHIYDEKGFCTGCGIYTVLEPTLVKIDGVWNYFENGVKTDATTVVKYNGTWFYVKDGIKNTATTLCKYKGTWYYISKGKIDFKATTLVKYNDTWYYVKNGKKNNATTLVKYKGTWYYVKSGKKSTDTTLVKYKGTWYYVKSGKKSTATTLVKYKGTWYYVKSGKKSTATTLCKYGSKYYYVKKGKKSTATAIVKFSGKKYYVKKGIAQTKFSGKVKISGKTYTVKKGIVK